MSTLKFRLFHLCWLPWCRGLCYSLCLFGHRSLPLSHGGHQVSLCHCMTGNKRAMGGPSIRILEFCLSFNQCANVLDEKFILIVYLHPKIADICFCSFFSFSNLGGGKRPPCQKIIFLLKTRSYAALRAADLDWIVGPGYSLGRVHSWEKPTWNHDKPTWNHEKPWKPTKNHKKTWNYLEKPWKPTKNHKKPWN